jgi:tetratricopeptide (TPR) repeat protein
VFVTSCFIHKIFENGEIYNMKSCILLILVIHFGCDVSYCAAKADSLTILKQDSLYQAGIRQYSEAQYERAIESFSSSPPETLKASAAFYTGLSYAALNDLKKAQRYLSEAVSKDSLNNSFRFNLGQLLARQGDIDGAIVEYKKIISNDTSFFPAYEQLGQLCELWQKETIPYRDSIWSLILHLRPDDYVALYYHGLSMFRKNMSDSGFVSLTRAVEEDSLFYAAVYELAIRNLARKNIEEAFHWYDRAVQLRPTNAKLLSEIGSLYEKAAKRRIALPYVLRATELDTTSATYAEQAGLLYYSFGSFDSASPYLRKATILEKDNWSYHLNLALAYSQMDSTRLAVRAYRDAIDAFHLSDGANLYLRLGEFLSSKKMFAEAKRSYDRALEIDPTNFEVRQRLGWTYFNMGNKESAIKEFQKYLDSTASDTSKSDARKRIKQTIEYLNTQKTQ